MLLLSARKRPGWGLSLIHIWRIRAGKMATTSAVNVGQFEDAMSAILEQGKDIPVSYTHLDVYKRQDQLHALPLRRGGNAVSGGVRGPGFQPRGTLIKADELVGVGQLELLSLIHI